ncbi:MAG: hypothetical protein WDM87_04165 [Terracidiphilus sp.]
MNPLTITTATFQVTGPSGPAIAGTVFYDPVNLIATFTPAVPLTWRRHVHRDRDQWSD